MIRNILFIGLMAFSSAASAQLAITIDPATVHAEGSVDESDIELHVTVTNESDVKVDLLWTRHETVKPDSWWTWICDLNSCYNFDVGVCPPSRVNTLLRGESMEFQVHAKAWGETGFAEIDIDLYDASDTANILGTVHATFEASVTSSIDDLQDITDLRVYPNPTTDYFRIYKSEQVAHVEVWNVVGKRMLAYRAQADGHYDVSEIPDGLYLVRLMDKQGAVLKTVRLSKG